MRHIELPSTGYGDCTALVGNDGSLLMVDWGSVNLKLRNPDMNMTGVFSILKDRYAYYPRRSFLLTHYHRDHLWGAQLAWERDPRYFSRVYLPRLPRDGEGRNILPELAAWAYALSSPHSELSRVNTACLTLPTKLWEAGVSLEFVGEGDAFAFDGVEYEVLNPPETDSFEPVLYEELEALYGSFPELGDLVKKTCVFYSRFQENPDNKAANELLNYVNEIHNFRQNSTNFSLSQDFLRAVSAAVNNSSVVFHNKNVSRTAADILMTGDIHRERFEQLFPGLHGSYYAMKAPHHGTAGGYSERMRELDIGHILIHNDEYSRELEIAPEYTELDVIKHCSGLYACPYRREYGACCNRLARCASNKRELALKCGHNRRGDRLPKCRIYVVTPAGGRSCFCD